MTDSTLQGDDFSKLVTAWMETAKSFYKDLDTGQGGGLSGAGMRFAFDEKTETEPGEEDKYKAYRSWETSAKNFTSFIRMMAAPENQEQLAHGMMTHAESFTEVLGDSLENFSDFQGQLLQSFAKIGEHSKAFSFDSLDHDTFESFRELYRQEFQKYLYIPKIGLPREFHEQLSRLADKTNIFHSHLHELLFLLFGPFDKTNRVVQEKVTQMFDRGEFQADTKQAYADWIKILEKHFMELLQSKEYTDVLNNTIIALAEYKKVKLDVSNVFLKELQVPTGKEMDEVYKEMYQMKKKIKELSQQVAQLQRNAQG